MTSLQALIFDVDGTIADTERHGHRVAFNRAFADLGLDWHWDEALYGELLAIAGGKERLQHYCRTYKPNWQPDPDLTTWVATVHRQKIQHYRQILETEGLPPRPGVLRLMREAQAAGVRLAIATTSALENVLTLLETTLGSASPDWFDCIAAGDMVSEKKPAPDIYHLALEKLALDPAQCLVIEDSDQGVQAAIAADLTTLVTVNGYTQNHDFTGAVLVVDHLGEPTAPCRAIAGPPLTQPCIDLALAQQLMPHKSVQ